jgi:peroxiredoxin
MLLGVCALGVAGFVLLHAAFAASSEPVKIGQAAPAFALQDDQGRDVSLASYSGKIVVLEWTNPQCPYVQRHYKEGTFTKLADKYKDQDVVWLAVNSSSSATKDVNRKWSEANKLSYPILDDSAGVVGHVYGAKTTPDLFIIDKQGKVVYMGGIDDDPEAKHADKRINYVDQALAEVTAGKPVTTPETKSYGCSVKYAK